jgi:4-hydroxymandelate oxidase
VDDPLNLRALEAIARERLDPVAWDYYAGGADDEVTLSRNEEGLRRLVLHPRVLVDVSARDPSTRLLGRPLALPVLLAPVAFQRLAHPDGEIASARAAAAAGTVFVLSTLSTTRMEDVVAAAPGAVWFQLYVYRDRSQTEALVRRAEAAGCGALVVTVDTPLLGRRERDVRNRFALPDGVAIANLHGHGAGMDALPPVASGSALSAYVASLFAASLSWADVTWLRGITRLPVVLKGILRPDDARRAVDAGASAIAVSNHGGRQLDGVAGAIDALGPICDAVAGSCEVLVDGGIRRGTDVVKAIALGARAVMIGRPMLWGLAAGGQDGVAAALAALARELDLAMALCGCPDVASIRRDLVG